jgi:hypothetical protein
MHLDTYWSLIFIAKWIKNAVYIFGAHKATVPTRRAIPHERTTMTTHHF